MIRATGKTPQTRFKTPKGKIINMGVCEKCGGELERCEDTDYPGKTFDVCHECESRRRANSIFMSEVQCPGRVPGEGE